MPVSRLELKIPPPVVLAVFGIAMYVVAMLVPQASIRLHPLMRAPLVVALGVAGISIALLAAWSFKRHRTTLNPFKPHESTSIVQTGPFRFSRNPMYLGMALVLAGWAVAISNALAFLLWPFFLFYMNAFQIKPEEAALRQRFGSAFEGYMQRVRRWL